MLNQNLRIIVKDRINVREVNSEPEINQSGFVNLQHYRN